MALNKLFGSKNRVKILEHLFFKEEIKSLRDLSRKINSPVSAVQREVKNLEKMGILKEDKKVTLNSNCPFLQDLKNIFIKTDFIASPLKEVFKKDKDYEIVFVFGSFAKGDLSNKSDLDIMIIANTSLSKVMKKIKPLEKIIKREINPVVWTKKELTEKKKTSFVKEIFSGKIIMIKGDEKDVRKIVK